MFTHPDYHYRAAGVIVWNEHILLRRSESDDFWSLPGGRMRLYEQAISALQRELQHQTSVAPVVGRLIWVVNGYFQTQGVLQHEVGLYHLVNFPRESAIYRLDTPFYGYEEPNQSQRLVFQWFPRQAGLLEQLPLLPKFLARAVEKLPVNPEYIVLRETNAAISI
jgi:ADP-ribose pyrophosphatase YjhB (NUDIX family)